MPHLALNAVRMSISPNKVVFIRLDGSSKGKAGGAAAAGAAAAAAVAGAAGYAVYKKKKRQELSLILFFLYIKGKFFV